MKSLAVFLSIATVMQASAAWTGDNGVCETTAKDDDIPVILPGKGQPNAIAIWPGADGVLDSVAAPTDDTKLGTGVVGGEPAFKIGYDARNQDGVPGQGTADPTSGFVNHFIVRYDGKIYDPSYGIGPYTSKDKHENAALAGIIHDIGGEMWVTRNDTTKLELKYPDPL